METMDLSFTPTEMPPWRTCAGAPTTSHMLSTIHRFTTNIPHPHRLMMAERSIDTTLAHFVFSVANIEGDGLPSLCQTQEFCALIAQDVEAVEAIHMHQFDESAALSTLHMLKATELLLLKCASNPVGAPPQLDIAFVRRLHETLFSDTAEWSHAGVFRKGSAFTRVSNQQILTYLNYRKIPEELERLLHKTNSLFQELFASQSQTNSEDMTTSILKLGGAFFLRFEEIHPFHDGNGRVGRLLLAYLLCPLTPFGPNSLYVLGKVDEFPIFVDRSAYLDCFRTDDTDMRDPSDVTALIIEGVYIAWKHFMQCVQDAIHSAGDSNKNET